MPYHGEFSRDLPEPPPLPERKRRKRGLIDLLPHIAEYAWTSLGYLTKFILYFPFILLVGAVVLGCFWILIALVA